MSSNTNSAHLAFVLDDESAHIARAIMADIRYKKPAIEAQVPYKEMDSYEGACRIARAVRDDVKENCLFNVDLSKEEKKLKIKEYKEEVRRYNSHLKYAKKDIRKETVNSVVRKNDIGGALGGEYRVQKVTKRARRNTRAIGPKRGYVRKTEGEKKGGNEESGVLESEKEESDEDTLFVSEHRK